jgi:hypothetical protein
MIKDEALKLALDYLESRGLAWNVQIALREALAQPEQEPVAWLSTDSIGERHLCFDKPLDNDPVQPLYTTPPQPEPVAWGNFKEDGTLVGLSQHPEDQANWTNRKPLYTSPPQQEPEPVAVVDANDEGYWADILPYRNVKVGQLLYTHTPQRTWVGLTDEEYTHITDTVFHTGQGLVAYYKAIEAKLKEKNT